MKELVVDQLILAHDKINALYSQGLTADDAWSIQKAEGYSILNSLALRLSDEVFYENFQSHVFEIDELRISMSVNMVQLPIPKQLKIPSRNRSRIESIGATSHGSSATLSNRLKSHPSFETLYISKVYVHDAVSLPWIAIVSNTLYFNT